jgi:putative membrane protein
MDYVGYGWGVGFCVWCSIIALGFILIYFLRGSSHNSEGHSSAQDILDKRFANGEINRQAYEESSNTLNKIA